MQRGSPVRPSLQLGTHCPLPAATLGSLIHMNRWQPPLCRVRGMAERVHYREGCNLAMVWSRLRGCPLHPCHVAAGAGPGCDGLLLDSPQAPAVAQFPAHLLGIPTRPIPGPMSHPCEVPYDNLLYQYRYFADTWVILGHGKYSFLDIVKGY